MLSSNKKRKINQQNFLDDTSWITTSELSNSMMKYADENFDKLFSLHPEQYGKIVMAKEVETKRFHKSYLNSPKLDERFDGNSYMFCGLNESANEKLPEEFQPFLDYMNNEQKKSDKPPYNQVTINWYENGNNYIPFHSDAEIGMIENATISILSLGGDIDGKPTRFFKFINKKNTTDRYEMDCHNGLIVTMGGTMQKNFRHGVPKSEISAPRISISFRQFYD